jgi:hypothetical protein
MNINKDLKEINVYLKEFLSHMIHILEYELMDELIKLNQMLIDNVMLKLEEDKDNEDHLLTVMV